MLIYKSGATSFADNPVTKRMYELGVIEQYLIPIKDEYGSLVGVCELCFKIDPLLNDSRKTVMKDYAQRLAIVLATYDEEDSAASDRKTSSLREIRRI